MTVKAGEAVFKLTEVSPSETSVGDGGLLDANGIDLRREELELPGLPGGWFRGTLGSVKGTFGVGFLIVASRSRQQIGLCRSRFRDLGDKDYSPLSRLQNALVLGRGAGVYPTTACRKERARAKKEFETNVAIDPAALESELQTHGARACVATPQPSFNCWATHVLTTPMASPGRDEEGLAMASCRPAAPDETELPRIPDEQHVHGTHMPPRPAGSRHERGRQAAPHCKAKQARLAAAACLCATMARHGKGKGTHAKKLHALSSPFADAAGSDARGQVKAPPRPPPAASWIQASASHPRRALAVYPRRPKSTQRAHIYFALARPLVLSVSAPPTQPSWSWLPRPSMAAPALPLYKYTSPLSTTHIHSPASFPPITLIQPITTRAPSSFLFSHHTAHSLHSLA
ncbi:hypothetical protein HU200_059345 [Digitaria exilis]|uniref:Uncharacterized protein n=1 Tax=Digitaria exilis TaxID=1010633 RepID=A0A835A8X7_9POAL|nr:hypothetical protein HU200_059345 [Digitaria exilis]CAB3468892.1 unnamed protein product [Digitaria exilis]